MDRTSPLSYLGSGWAFPLSVNGRGGTALVSQDEAVARAIRIILSTAKGERRMRPQFGCGIHEYVYSPNNSMTRDIIEHEVREAIGRWEPRVTMQEVTLETDPMQDGLLLIHVSYFIKATNDERNLVYPFYLIPGED